MIRHQPTVNKMIATLCILLVATLTAEQASAVVITGGSATFTMNEGLSAALGEFDAFFDATRTRAQVLSDPAPGNAPFTESPADPASGVVTFVDSIRPSSEPVSPGTPGSGRSPQATTLDFDPADVLGTWSPSSDDFGAFVGSISTGEQIAFTGMTRWTGPFTGTLVYGDFALRYTGSKLVLTSNIDFLSARFLDIGSPTITVAGPTLTITGDLLIGGGLALLDPTSVPGTDVGDFRMVATINNGSNPTIPEPASAGLIASGALLLLLRRRRGA